MNLNAPSTLFVSFLARTSIIKTVAVGTCTFLFLLLPSATAQQPPLTIEEIPPTDVPAVRVESSLNTPLPIESVPAENVPTGSSPVLQKPGTPEVISETASILQVPVVPDAIAPAAAAQNSNAWASIGTCEAPDFYVLDSNQCPQSVRQGYPCCNARVFRFLPDHRYHHDSESGMFQSLEPGVPVCLFIHGSFVNDNSLYPATIDRYKFLTSASGNRPMHFLALHWPSDPGPLLMPIIQVNQLGRAAEYNGIYVAQLISKIPPDHPICLIGHSHGCRVVASALHLLGGGTVKGFSVSDPHPSRPIRAVLGAAAIDHHWMNPGERYGCALDRVERLLNFRSRHDMVLKLYPLREPHFDHAVGQVGFLDRDVARMGPRAHKIRQYDVTHLVGHRHVISAYDKFPQLRSMLVPYMHFDPLP